MAPHTITEPPQTRSTGLTLHGAKRSPIRLYTRWRPSARYSLNRDLSLNIIRRQSWFLQTPCRWLLAQFRRRRLLRSFMTIPTYGRRARKPCSRKRSFTVFALIRLSALPGVPAAVAAALRNRSRIWIRRIPRSWFGVVTRGQPLLCRSRVRAVSWKRLCKS